MRATDLPLPSSNTSKWAPKFESLQQAARWFACLRSEDVTDKDRAGWRAWHEQHAEHREAWKYVETVSQRFENLQPESEQHAAAAALKAAQRVTRRQALNMIAILAGGGMLGWTTIQHAPLPAMASGADYRTGTGEIREITLADGTRVWLNTASALNADYRPSLRHVRLVAGEVLIETAQDAGRPFVVDTSQGRLRALGTRFTVRQFDGATYLAVYEGAVEVRTAGNDATQVVQAGEQVTFSSDVISPPMPAERARKAWARNVLLADNIPLKDLIEELARYRRGHLGVTPAIADLRVMGTYPLDDPDRVLAMLESALPVQVRRTLPWWVTVEARPTGR